MRWLRAKSLEGRGRELVLRGTGVPVRNVLASSCCAYVPRRRSKRRIQMEPETRRYVERVMTNWIRYAYLAGDEHVLSKVSLTLPSALALDADAY